jgi:hypothetical protein
MDIETLSAGMGEAGRADPSKTTQLKLHPPMPLPSQGKQTSQWNAVNRYAPMT